MAGSFLDIGGRIARTPDLTKPRLDLGPCSCKDRTPKTLLDSSKKRVPTAQGGIANAFAF